ncbi:MAG: hypothetical protein AAF393_14985 [Pseudomonadota bacterium]
MAPPKDLKLTLPEFGKQTSAFKKELDLGIKKLKIDPKLKAKILALNVSLDKKITAQGKKNAKNGEIDLKKFTRDVIAAYMGYQKDLDLLTGKYEPVDPKWKLDPKVEEKDWGKIKIKSKKTGLFLYVKPKIKDGKIKKEIMGGWDIKHDIGGGG